MAERKKPLDGIKVIDLTRALSGPICTCMLADYGAHVIKVEGLDCELMRGYPTGGMAKKDAKVNDGFRNFASIHRNKDTVCMNLRDPDCKAILMDPFLWGCARRRALRSSAGYLFRLFHSC